MRGRLLPGRMTYVAIAALTALAAVLVFWELGDKGLNLDEAISVGWAREGAAGLWDVVSGKDPTAGFTTSCSTAGSVCSATRRPPPGRWVPSPLCSACLPWPCWAPGCSGGPPG